MNDLLLKAPPVTEAYDATLLEFQTYAQGVEEWFLKQGKSYQAIDEEARQHSDPNEAIGFRIALKMAESHRILRELDRPLTITLLNPVYKETGRIQRREEHPHGENSIRCKVEALKGLEALNSNLSCRMIVIDDECPDGSGRMVEEIFRSEYADDFSSGGYQVFFLRDAIDEGGEDVPPGLTHKDGANRSVKGGALLYGMRKALQSEVDGLHIIVDNDADLSIHPAQLGLLVEAIVAGEAEAVAGSRREENSVSLIGGSRNTRGQLFIQIWQHFLPGLAAAHIIDTNRAFKAFTSDALKKILPRIEIYTFPYQIELLQACVSEGVALKKRGIAYVDSEAASTQQGEGITETYLNQVHQIIDIARRYGTIGEDDALLKFFEEISEERWMQIEIDPPESVLDLLS
jgi:hypothetical protein